MHRPLLTVAVSTFRETYFDWVVQLLESLENQTFGDFEIVLVVNRNQAYFERLQTKVKTETHMQHKVRIVFNPVDKGIAHARNIALRYASTPYIAFTDDDVILQNRWLEALVEVLETNSQVVVVVGPVMAKWDPLSKKTASWFPQTLYWTVGCTPDRTGEIREVRNGFASNLALRRTFAIECGGFNEQFGYNPTNLMVGEEPELGLRIIKAGRLSLWNPKAIIYHRVTNERTKARNLTIRSFVEGKTKAILRRMYGSKSTLSETNHMRLLIKDFFTAQSFRAKTFLFITTIAVAIGFLSYLGFKIGTESHSPNTSKV